MRQMEATAAQLAAFASALEKQLIGRRTTNDAFAKQVAAELGVPSMTDETVRNYRTGKREPGRAVVFAMERVLELRPGALSKHLGYLPLNAKPAVATIDAIENDTDIDHKARARLVGLYRSERES